MKIHRLTETTGYQTALDVDISIRTTFESNVTAALSIVTDINNMQLDKLDKKQLEFFRDLLSHTIERMEYVD